MKNCHLNDLQKTFVTSYQLQITNNTIELIATVLPKKKKEHKETFYLFSSTNYCDASNCRMLINLTRGTYCIMKYCSRKFLDFSTIVPKKEPLYMGGRDKGEKRNLQTLATE